MDTRLPFKRTRLATAHKVRDLATKIGHTKFADAMDVGIERIEKEIGGSSVSQNGSARRNDNNTKTTGGDTHDEGLEHRHHSRSFSPSSAYAFGRPKEEAKPERHTHDEDDDPAYGNDGNPERDEPKRHSPIPGHSYRHSEEQRLQKKTMMKAQPQRQSKTEPSMEAKKYPSKERDKRPLGEVPKFSFKIGVKKGLVTYVRNIIQYELNNEVERRTQEQLNNNSGGQERGRESMESSRTRSPQDRARTRQRSEERSDNLTLGRQRWRDLRVREHDQEDIIRKEHEVRKAPPSKLQERRQMARGEDFPIQYASGANGPGPSQTLERDNIEEPVPMSDPAALVSTGSSTKTSRPTSPFPISDDEEKHINQALQTRTLTPPPQNPFDDGLDYEDSTEMDQPERQEEKQRTTTLNLPIQEDGGWAFPPDKSPSSPRQGSMSSIQSNETAQGQLAQRPDHNRRRGTGAPPIKVESIYRVNTNAAVARWGDPVKSAKERADARGK